MNTFDRYIIDKNSFKYLLILFICLASLKFYTLFIPYSMGKALVLAGVGTIVFFYLIFIVYDKSFEFEKRYTLPIILIFLGLITSTFAAALMHEQSVTNTLLAQHEFYFFLFYFMLHRAKPDPKPLLKMFAYLGYGYCVVYLLQYFAFPREILSSKVFMDRGTVRIFMPGAGYLFTTYFLMLSWYFIHKKVKYLLGLIPLLIILFLLGTRQLIASMALLTVLNILLSKTIKSKLIMGFLLVLCLIPLYYLFQGIFAQMFEVTLDQSESVEDNIRFLAARYFLVEFNDNPIWIITGNGMPDHGSHYGKFILGLTEKFGYYQADIGIIGDFSKFGILFVIGQMGLLIKLVFSKTRESHRFILYNSLSILMTMFTGSGLHAHTIALICMMMYITDVDKYFLNQNKMLQTPKDQGK